MIRKRSFLYHSPKKKKHPYEDHLDFKTLTPSRLCKPLMLTAQLFFPMGATALWKGYYSLSCFLFPVCFTSVWHWHDPKTSSWARTLDITAVLSAFCYGTYTSFQMPPQITTLWCSTALFQACVFSINALLFSHQVEKPNALILAAYNEEKKDDENLLDWYKNTFVDECKPKLESSTWSTWPMTRERELAYCRGVYIHMVCVHIIPCTLAIYCLSVAPGL
jgi:hypothetical protein